MKEAFPAASPLPKFCTSLFHAVPNTGTLGVRRLYANLCSHTNAQIPKMVDGECGRPLCCGCVPRDRGAW